MWDFSIIELALEELLMSFCILARDVATLQVEVTSDFFQHCFRKLWKLFQSVVSLAFPISVLYNCS